MYGQPPPPVWRLRIGPPGREAPRPHPKHPHPPSVVEAVRHLIETTRKTYREIDTLTGVNHGTIARWVEAHGWTRPPGAAPRTARPEKRWVPVLVGEALARRMRVQAERLVAEIERAPSVDPAALAGALNLLAQAREEQKVRRGKKRQPPPPRPPPDPAVTAAMEAAREQEAERDRILREHGRARHPRDRAAAARKGWKGRYARMAHHAWMMEKE